MSNAYRSMSVGMNFDFSFNDTQWHSTYVSDVLHAPAIVWLALFLGAARIHLAKRKCYVTLRYDNVNKVDYRMRASTQRRNKI